MRTRVLVFGGAAGFDHIVRDLARGGWTVTTVLPAGTTLTAPHGEVIIGTSGGPAAVARYAMDHRVDVIVDASDPFDVELSVDATEVSLATQLPLVTFDPPSWRVEATRASGLKALAPQLHQTYHHIMVDWANGRLDPTPLRKDPDNLYVFRRTPPKLPRASLPPRFRLLDQPLMDSPAERKILRDNQCDALVLPDTGEPVCTGLLDAARSSGVDIFLIDRLRTIPRHATIAHSVAETLRAVEV